MADLTELQSSGSTKIAGADPSTGVEDNFLEVDSLGRITTKLTDGAGNPITSQASGSQRALDVGIDVGGVQIDPRQIRQLNVDDIVSVIQLSSPWVTYGLSEGSVTGSAAATQATLVAGVFTSSLPTLTTGQQAALRVDSSSRLLIGSIASALPTGTNNIGKVNIQDSTGAAITTSNPLPIKVSAATLNGGGSIGALTVGTSAVLVNVSGTNLASRKGVTLYNNGTVTLYWGLANTVTTSTGTPISPGFQAVWEAGPTTNIYVISGTASQNTRITEMT